MSVINKIISRPMDYIELKLLGLKEHLKEDVGESLSKVIIFGTIGILCLFAVLFLSFGLALFLNYLLNSSAAGFIIVGVLYVGGAAVLFMMRNKNFVYRRSDKYARLLLRHEARKTRKALEKIRVNGHQTVHAKGKSRAVETLQ